jgi:parallel beta-helix repeat protein
VSGTGLYVNAGGGNPATHQAAIGRRRFGITLPARSFVTIDGFTITRTEDRGINLSTGCNNVTLTHNTITFANKAGIGIVGGSGHRLGSNIVHDSGDHGIALFSGVTASTIEDNECYRNARGYERAANGIHLNGCPSNTLRRNRVHDNEDTGLHIQSGSNNCIEYLNQSWNNGDHGFDHLASTGTIHNSDVAYGNFMDGFSIEGGATGTQLHNCIAANNGTTTGEFDLWVEDTSVNGFVSNYNIFWNSTAQAPVKYMTTIYDTVSVYAAASGKDAKTLQSNPLFVSPANGNFHLGTGSPRSTPPTRVPRTGRRSTPTASPASTPTASRTPVPDPSTSPTAAPTSSAARRTTRRRTGPSTRRPTTSRSSPARASTSPARAPTPTTTCRSPTPGTSAAARPTRSSRIRVPWCSPPQARTP